MHCVKQPFFWFTTHCLSFPFSNCEEELKKNKTKSTRESSLIEETKNCLCISKTCVWALKNYDEDIFHALQESQEK